MNLYARRRAIAREKGDRLPNAYQKVEYLKSTGEQYIDTGLDISIISNLTTDWELWFEVIRTKSAYIIAGSNDDIKQLPFLGDQLRAGDWCQRSGGYLSPIVTIQINKKYSLQQKNGYLIINDVSYRINYASESSCHFGIFGKIYENGSTEISTLTNMKFYGFKAESNGDRIADIVPCYRKADSKPGAYDTVRHVFYTNAGTGEFIVPD